MMKMSVPLSVRKISIDDARLGLSVRIINILESNGVCTLGGLLTKSYFKLWCLQGFGETSAHEVRAALARFDLSLKDDPKVYPIANPCPLCGHERDETNHD